MITLLLALSAAFAQEAPATPVYRQVATTQGLSFVAQVNASEGDVLVLGTPLGSLRLPLDQVASLKPSDRFAYDGQPRWHLVVSATPAEEERLTRLALGIPGTKLVSRTGKDLPPEASALVDCAPADAACAAASTATLSNRVVLAASTTEAGARLVVQIGQGELRQELVPTRDDAMWAEIHRILQLTPQGPPPPPPPSWAKELSQGPKRSFVPLPGYSQFKEGEIGLGLAATGLTAAAVAAWVGVTGSGAANAGEHAAVGTLGALVLTVGLHQALPDGKAAARKR